MPVGCWLVAVVLMSSCAAPAVSPAVPGTGKPRWAIIDVDRHGVLLFDVQTRQYRGVNRAGDVVWQAAGSAPLATCVGACPDAALSGSFESFNSADVPDPLPTLMIAGRASTLDTRERVLWGAAPDDLVTSSGSTLRLGNQRIAVGGRHTAFATSADGLFALALTTIEGGTANEARWFTRSDGVWMLSGQVGHVAGSRACVATDGSQALLLGPRPSLLDRAGRRTPVTDLVGAGACAFTRSGIIVAELASGVGGAGRSRLRALRKDGVVVWSLDLGTQVAVCGDALSTRFVYVAAGTAHEIDARDGTAVRSTHDVSAACYDGAGDLIVVRPNGQISRV